MTNTLDEVRQGKARKGKVCCQRILYLSCVIEQILQEITKLQRMKVKRYSSGKPNLAKAEVFSFIVQNIYMNIH